MKKKNSFNFSHVRQVYAPIYVVWAQQQLFARVINMKTQRAHQVVGVRCGLEAPLKKNLGTFVGGSRRRENSAHLKNARCPWESLLSFLFPIYFFFRYFCIIKVCVWFFFFSLITTCFSLVLFYFASKCGWVGERMNGESERHWRRDNRTKK